MLEDWFKKIYFPNSGNDSILLLDSLTTYKDRVEIDKSKPNNQKYQVITIPGGITGYVQPLDVLFNRTYKTFVRRLSDHINFYHEEIKLHQRDTNIRLQTIVHHQFRSPRFNQFIRHSWIKSGLTDNLNRDQHEDDDSSVLWFDDPNGFCFDALKILNNKCVFCPEKPCFNQNFHSNIIRNILLNKLSIVILFVKRNKHAIEVILRSLELNLLCYNIFFLFTEPNPTNIITTHL